MEKNSINSLNYWKEKKIVELYVYSVDYPTYAYNGYKLNVHSEKHLYRNVCSAPSKCCIPIFAFVSLVNSI